MLKKSRKIIALAILLPYFFCEVFAQTYPQFDISGYKKWKYNKLIVDPISNYYVAQTQLGWGITTVNPWEERLSLKIDSKISEKLYVSYDIEQEPDTPQKSNVKVKYDNFLINFGEFQATFSENEFISANKYVDGVMVDYDDGNTKVKVVPSSKSKSYNQPLTSAVGNNTRGPYSLGRGGIIEGTEKIWVNDRLQKRGIDYTIDYFEGKITFTNILSPTDRFSYTYEYTNIIDLFFPTISKRDFVGISASTNLNNLFVSPSPEIVSLVSIQSTEVFPKKIASIENSESQSQKDVFKLEHFPVVEFSEEINFQGKKLKKPDEYTINYNEGTIVLFVDKLPSEEEPLKVKYSYYEIEENSETITGIDSKGPYSLKKANVVKDSEKILVDNKEYFKDLDYSVDYKNGKIIFNNKIPSTSTIKISYSSIKTIKQVVQNENNNRVRLGGTYLKESAKRGAGSATATKIETRKGSEIVNDLLSLKNFPIDSSQPIVVKVDGIEYKDFYVPTSDAQSLSLPYITDSADPTDGYATGTIKFNTPISPTSEVTIMYTYKKSIFGKFTGSGNGSQGPYYITNMPQMVPGSDVSLIVRSEGSSVVETYTKNSSKTSVDGQYKINYNYPYIPYITFNEPFPIEKKFEISFYYVPSSGSFQDSDLIHDALGLTTNISVLDKVNVDAAFGLSRTDQPMITESQKDTIYGNNTRGPYQLTKTNIIDGSEIVYVNGFRQNKDIDYFMNYTTGQITFYYLTLTPKDKIEVEYNYQSISGIATTTEIRTGKAFKISGTVKPISELQLSGTFKEIEPEFSQFESTNIGSGSQQKGLNFSFSPKSFYSVNAGLLETKNQKGSFKGFYTWSTDRNIVLNLNIFNIFDTGVSFRNYKSIDDITPGSSSHSVNTVSNVLSGTLTPKQIEIGKVKFTNSNSFSKNETLNYLNDSSTFTNYFKTSNSLGLGDRISFGIDYQVSEPISSTKEGITSHSISKDYIYDAFWDLKFGTIKNFSARGKIITHDQKDLINLTNNFTKNQSINVVLEPLTNLSASLDKSRTESLAVQEGKPNPITERNQYSIRFSPLSNISLSYANSDDRSIQESGAKNKGMAQNLSILFTPFSFLRLGAYFNNQNRETTSVSGTIETTTFQSSESQMYTAGITLNPFNLFSLNSDIALENYKNNNELGNIQTETQNIVTKSGISFSPLPIMTVSGNYTKKITKDILKKTEIPKENWDSATSIRVFNLGTLTYTWSQERNLGEVQAGAVTSLDILRITNNLTFSTTIPQSSPVLSSIVLSANYKSMVYSDNLNSANSFKASALTFEGTLNF